VWSAYLAHYDGAETINSAVGPYAASPTAKTKNLSVGRASVSSQQRHQLLNPRASGEEYVRLCCPGLHSSLAALQ